MEDGKKERKKGAATLAKMLRKRVDEINKIVSDLEDSEADFKIEVVDNKFEVGEIKLVASL